MPTPTETTDNRGLDLDTLQQLTSGAFTSVPIPSKLDARPTNGDTRSGNTASGGNAVAAPATETGGREKRPGNDGADAASASTAAGGDGSAHVPDDADEGSDAVPNLDWTRATEARKQLKTRVKELESEITKLRGRPTSAIDTTAFEAIKKEKEDLESNLQSLAIERSPKFQAWYKGESETISQVAKGISTAHAAQIEKLLDMPSGKQRMGDLEKLSEELTPGQVTALNVALLDMDKLNYRKHDIVTKQRESWIAQQREVEMQEKAATENRKKEWEKSFQDVFASAAENLPVYKERDGEEDWNKTVKSNVALAKRMYNGDDMTPTDLAKAALWAAAAPTFLKQLSQAQAENAKLAKELEAFKSSSPTPRGGSGASAQPSGSAQPDGGYLDTVLKMGTEAGFIR